MQELARLLEMNVGELNGKLAASALRSPAPVPPEVAQAVADLRLPGIHQQKEYRRYYPGGEVMAHILGFTDLEDRGPGGGSSSLDKRLSVAPARAPVIKDRRGQIVEDVEAIRPHATATMWRVDRRQDPASRLVRPARGDEEHKPKAAAVVARCAHRRGARAGQPPTFNPNNRANLTGAHRNRAVPLTPSSPAR